MQTAFPCDRFEAIFFEARGWRMKCFDCPGKLYTPGPGETLSNFHIHLRNRRHRSLVADRF
ncbi:hypothetical protein BDN70DRAFT_812942 [Pholiota conissans]|uniref:Uncharacterized protein n=1 Tax=Pholiota conissans TaxID=109636 RepID=A0A9P5YUG3_9AGAR|nr:hypothetical protein BDN70DRAFT_812942 [Pholiota conissans]